MKVMLHGYLFETNFGDILFAHLFYRQCKELGFESVDFLTWRSHGIGPYCANELGYTPKKSLLSCLSADAYVLISGGSLGEAKPDLRESIRRYFRFVFPTRLFQLMGKPVYVLGVGGGPIYSPWLQKRVAKMLNRSLLVQVRDQETKDFFIQYGVKRDILVTSDTAQVITAELLPPCEVKAQLDAFAGGRKKLFLHLSENDGVNVQITEKVVPGLMRFLEEHPEYVVVVGFDNVRISDPEKRLRELKAVGLLSERYDVFLYNYTDSWQLCSLLNEMDCAVTQKLHVGIISASLGKSVLSFPVHVKTSRYYRQIGEPGRCIPMQEATPELVYRQLECYHAQKIELPQHIRQSAAKNLTALEELDR